MSDMWLGFLMGCMFGASIAGYAMGVYVSGWSYKPAPRGKIKTTLNTPYRTNAHKEYHEECVVCGASIYGASIYNDAVSLRHPSGVGHYRVCSKCVEPLRSLMQRRSMHGRYAWIELYFATRDEKAALPCVNNLRLQIVGWGRCTRYNETTQQFYYSGHS